MRFRRLQITTLMVIAAVVSVAVPRLRAQQAGNDVAVVSIAPIDRLLKDTSYVLQACNVPEIGGMVSVLANQYTQGLDRTRPIGARVSLAGGMPNALIFLPMNDRSQFFAALAGMGIEPDDLGDGLFEISSPDGQVVFAKDTNGWMYVAQTEDALGNLPEDPAAMLGDLPDNYDVAIRLNAGEIPQQFKDPILEQIRIGFERSLAQQPGQSDEEREAAAEVGEASIAQIEQLIQQTDQLIFGWSVSGEDQRTHIDTGIKFVEGSKLAEQVKMASEVTSNYTDFYLPYAAARFRFSSVIPESDRALTKSSLQNSMSQVESQLEQLDDLPQEVKELLTELLSGLSTIMERTIDEGKFDGAGSMSVADDTLRLLIGGRIADGSALAEEFKQAAAKLPQDAGAPEFEFDYENYQGVNLHRVSSSLEAADPAVRRIFGDEMLITIGTAEKSYLIALDPTGDALVKSAIDKLATTPAEQASPFEGVIALEDILRFAQAVSPNSILDNAVNMISQYADKDKIELSSRFIERGALYRLSIEEGVLRSIGAAAKGAAPGAAPPGAQQGF